MAVSFDLFDTLVTADRPTAPWDAVADALAQRDVCVPEDWESAYRSSHVDVDPLAELSLVEHTEAALASRDIEVEANLLHAVLLEAFDGPVNVRDGADVALRAAGALGPVGVLSNCSLPGLVEQTLDRASLSPSIDAVVTSVGCGWRKPHDRSFTAVADALSADLDDLVHVGDDPRADGGGRTAGVTVILTSETPLSDLPSRLEAVL